MLKKLNPIKMQQLLREKEIMIFSPEELRRLFGASRAAVNFFLNYHSKEGFFIKLKNGLYALSSWFPPEQLIANKLYEPSYLSFEYAMAHYHLIPEAIYAITSVSPRATREFEVQGKRYLYHHLSRDCFRGYRSERIGRHTIWIATAEKALADYLYFVDLGRKTLNERLSLRGIRQRDLMRYLALFKRESLKKLAKRLL